MSPTVSIIMPAYNAGKYLDDAVNSVVSQSFADWELLLVDDGSTDSTPSMCDLLASYDPRIRVYHKPNGGLSDARNYGLDRACGEYVAFLDADDVLSSQFLRCLVHEARTHGMRIVCAGHERFAGEEPRGLRLRSADGANAVSLTSREAISHALYQTPAPGTGMIPDHSAWGKLYGRELWEKERFTPGTWYEDLDVFTRVWSRCEAVRVIEARLLGYRQHDGSFLHRFTPGRLDVLDVTDRLAASLAHDTELGAAARTRRFAAHYNILALMYAGGIDDPAAEERCRAVICAERRRVLMDRNARRRDRMGALVSFGGFGMVRKLACKTKN